MPANTPGLCGVMNFTVAELESALVERTAQRDALLGRGYDLAMLVLQSDRYQKDPDYRDAEIGRAHV